jgi:eukaryotic-like serine/threonine-protein kinase
MGAVYVVEQVSTGKQRALKLMLPQLVADAALRKRFEQEARVGALIESEHVVEVVGAGVDAATNTPWLAMELLVGEDLSELVARQGALGAKDVLVIFEQLCHAVGAAHRVGIVHRDLKPENIFIARSRRAGAEITVKVLDFGIAKIVAEAKTSGTAAVGSPMWMAPEQTDGAPITPATDVWALGLVAFNLLTGRFFWTAANAAEATVTQLLREILFESIPSASARANELSASRPFPAALNDWFAHCVVRDPTARFQDASAALHSLRNVLSADDRMASPGLIERVEQALSAAGVTGRSGSVAKVDEVPTPVEQGVHGAMGTMAPSAKTAPEMQDAWRAEPEGSGRSRARPAAAAVASVIAIVAVLAATRRMFSRHELRTAAGLPVASLSSAPVVSSASSSPSSTDTAEPTHPVLPPTAVTSSPGSSAHEAPLARSPTTARPLSSAAVHRPLPDESAGAPEQAAPCVSEEQAQRTVRLHFLGLRHCYERSRVFGSPVNVDVTLTVSTDGLPENVTATGDDPPVARCVEGHVRLWHFAAMGCTQRISIPLRFPLSARAE